MKTSYPSYPINAKPSIYNTFSRVTSSKNILPYLTLSYPLFRVTWVTWVTTTYPLQSLMFTGLGKKVTFFTKILQKNFLIFKITILLLILISCQKEEYQHITLKYDTEDNLINYQNKWHKNPTKLYKIKIKSDTIFFYTFYQTLKLKPIHFLNKNHQIIYQNNHHKIIVKYPNLYKHLDKQYYLTFKLIQNENTNSNYHSNHTNKLQKQKNNQFTKTKTNTTNR